MVRKAGKRLERKRLERMGLITRIILVYYSHKGSKVGLEKIRKFKKLQSLQGIKKVIVYTLAEYGFTSHEVAEYLHHRDTSRIHEMAREIRARRKTDKTLDRELKVIEARLLPKSTIPPFESEVASAEKSRTQAIDEEEAEPAGGERSSIKADRRVISRIICGHFDVTHGMLCSLVKTKDLAHARAVFNYLLRKYTDMSFPDIGKFVGGRGHQPVIKACQNIAQRLKGDLDFRIEVATLEERIIQSVTQ